MMIRRRAFTLLEVILALSLLVFLLTILFQFYSNVMRNRQRGLISVQEAHLARVLLGQITKEIRSSAGFVPGFGSGVIGDRYELSIQTVGVPSKELFRRRDRFENPLPGQHDIKRLHRPGRRDESTHAPGRYHGDYKYPQRRCLQHSARTSDRLLGW